MAKYSASGAVITLTVTGSAHIVSADCESYEIKDGRAVEEVSGFGEHENYVWGQEVFGVDIEAWYGTSGSTVGIFNVLRICKQNSMAVGVSIKPESGGLTLAGTFLFEEYAVQGNKKGEGIKLGTISFVPASGYAKPSWS
jgi:hypothetical protein